MPVESRDATARRGRVARSCVTEVHERRSHWGVSDLSATLNELPDRPPCGDRRSDRQNGGGGSMHCTLDQRGQSAAGRNDWSLAVAGRGAAPSVCRVGEWRSASFGRTTRVDHSAARAGRAGAPRRRAERFCWFAHTRGNVWRYEPGAKGRRHRHRLQEETFVVLAGTLSMYVGDPPERQEVPAGGLIHIDPGLRCRPQPRHRRARPIRLRIPARERARRAPRLTFACH